jgi:arylsulfatase A-like enzyme
MKILFRPVLVAGLLSITAGSVCAAPNILLIIGDDMGVETLASYGLGDNPPTTAALDRLASEGIRFSNFWSQPVCSPTRATVMTGRYGFRTGIGRPTANGPPMPELPPKPEWATFEISGMGGGMAGGEVEVRPYLLADEFTLPMAFKAGEGLGYATAAIGKWHLADVPNGWLDHPNLAGFDHYSGILTGTTPSFFAWNKVVNGKVSGTVGYAPADKADDAIRWIGEQGDTPWLLWFAFNLPHTPLHLPPKENWQSDYSHLDAQSIPEDSADEYFAAMVEAMDTQIGRLLASLESDVRANTYVIFMGDNGTTSGSVSPPFRAGRAKGTVYEGGVNVPLIVTGPGVARGAVSDALVNSTDLFVTLMEMAEIDPEEAIPESVTHDSISFFPLLSDPEARTERDWLYADYFYGGFAGVPDADYAMRDRRYKLLRFQGREELYDLQEDPYEHHDLLTGTLSAGQRAGYEMLQERIRTLRSAE